MTDSSSQEHTRQTVEDQPTDEINPMILDADDGEEFAIWLQNNIKVVAQLGSVEMHTEDWLDGMLQSYEVELDSDLRASDPTPPWLRNATAIIGSSRVDDEPYDRPELEVAPYELDGTLARAEYDGPYPLSRMESYNG